MSDINIIISEPNLINLEVQPEQADLRIAGFQGPAGSSPNTPIAFAFWVDGTNGSDSNNGSIGAPYKTIQAAITAATPDYLITVFPGTYTEDLNFTNDRVTLTAEYNTTDSYLVSINGEHTFDPGVTRIRMQGLQLNDSGVASSTLINFTGSGGRCFFDNVSFNATGAGSQSCLFGTGNNFNVFRDCTFSGIFDMSGSVAGVTNFMTHCMNSSGEIQQAAGTLTITDSVSNPYITHTGGTLSIKGAALFGRDGSGRAINSTASFSAGNTVRISDATMYDISTDDFAIIRITDCDYVISTTERDPSIDIFPTNPQRRIQRPIQADDMSGAKPIEIMVFS